jgi:hypothetical protein
LYFPKADLTFGRRTLRPGCRVWAQAGWIGLSLERGEGPARCPSFTMPDFSQPSPMSMRLYERLTAWFHAHRPLRWIETIAGDYSDWNPLD